MRVERLGIPITFSSDPRHGAVLGAHVQGMQFVSQWPSREGYFGIAATRDVELARDFERVIAEEYRCGPDTPMLERCQVLEDGFVWLRYRLGADGQQIWGPSTSSLACSTGLSVCVETFTADYPPPAQSGRFQ